jgi:hypothetical protein
MRCQLSSAKREEVLKRYWYICVYCFGEADQVEHIIPNAWIVTNIDDNLVATCEACNIHLSDMIFHPTSFSIALIKKQKYIRELLGRTRRKDPRSKCPDCHSYFRPLIDGATMLLCSKCQDKRLGIAERREQEHIDVINKQKNEDKKRDLWVKGWLKELTRSLYLLPAKAQPIQELPINKLILFNQAACFLGITKNELRRQCIIHSLKPERIGRGWYFESGDINRIQKGMTAAIYTKAYKWVPPQKRIDN